MILIVIAQKKSFILKFVTNCDGGHYKVWQLNFVLSVACVDGL